MLSLIRRSHPEKAEPGAMRAAREAFGWSQERLAEEMGVLPAEITAWESGAIALDPHRAEVMRWRMEHAEYLARLPRSECYWTRANEDRLERMKQVGARSRLRAAVEIEAHARECTECMRVQALLTEVPPRPEEPVPPGFFGWREVARRRTAATPAWLRGPLRLAADLLSSALLYVGVMGVFFALDPDDGLDLSAETFALLFAGVRWLTFIMRRLERLALRHPYAAGLATAAALAIPANLALAVFGHTDLSSESTWTLFAIGAVVGGWLLGVAAEHADSEESKALDPPPAGPVPEEREIVIPQQDTSWRA